MTTATLTQPTPTRPLRSIVVGGMLLLAAITVVLVLTVGRIAGTSGTSSGGGQGQDTSGCRPTTAVHFC